MSHIAIGSSIFFLGVLTCLNTQAQDASTTTVNPVTQETTTTTVNPDTNQTIVTKTNPTTQESTTTIYTPAPAPQEVVSTPQGYTNCFTVSAGWYNNEWISQHNVCQYSSTESEGIAWIEGHWICTQYKASEGACTKWEWKSGRWVKTFEVY
jgi:hypothetical protein